MAIRISNAESPEALAELAKEQAALRVVATLVARDAPSTEVFEAVAAEVGRLLDTDVTVVGRYDGDGAATAIGSWSASGGGVPVGTRSSIGGRNVLTLVAETGMPARMEGYDDASGEAAEIARRFGWRSSIAAPIVVKDRLWGVMLVATRRPEPFSAGAEQRLAAFTELVATAVGNAEARREVERLAEEQAALRRVAVLVAQQPSPGEVFTAVTEAVGLVLRADLAGLNVFEGDATTTIAGWSGDGGPIPPVGSRFSLHGDSVVARIFETGAPARIDNYAEAEGEAADAARNLRLRSTVGAPIVVQGKLWGALVAGTRGIEPWAENAETRIGAFTELVATAIANAESREALAKLAEEQAALRRVATLVARDASSTEVFEAVATEVGRVLDTDMAVLGRYDGDGSATAIGSWSASGEGAPVGIRSAVGGRNVLTIVAETGKPARMEESDGATGEAAEIARHYGWRSSIGAPIVVEGRVWGVMLVGTQGPEPVPAGAEERLAAFTDLVATAVANTESRHTLERVAAQQAALRRVATLVAQGRAPQDLFDAVAEEVGRLLPAANVSMGRYESDETITSMASWSSVGPTFPPGVRWPIKGTNAAWMVLQTGKPARIDDFSVATDPIGVAVREAGYTSAVGSPIVVEGHLWGVISVASTEGVMPPETEERLVSFTELVATAIANAEGSAELAASRRRIVAAADDARRRIERDLHDGVQQQLVSLGLELGAMKADPPIGDELKEQLASVTEGMGSVIDALVETARGIHPAILSKGGLAPALRALARRSAVPVELHARIDVELPDAVEVAAYYVAAEALTNVAKHARASVAQMDATTDDGTLTLVVRDDGVGGAEPGGGSGLIGLRDRVEALGGTIRIESSAGSGTGIVVTLPTRMEPDGLLPGLAP